MLAIEKGHHLHDQVAEICEDFNAILLRDYEGTSLDTLRLMVGMGVGLAFMPALYVQSEISSRDEISVLDLKNANLYRQVGLTWRRRSVQSIRLPVRAESSAAVGMIMPVRIERGSSGLSGFVCSHSKKSA